MDPIPPSVYASLTPLEYAQRWVKDRSQHPHTEQMLRDHIKSESSLEGDELDARIKAVVKEFKGTGKRILGLQKANNNKVDDGYINHVLGEKEDS